MTKPFRVSAQMRHEPNFCFRCQQTVNNLSFSMVIDSWDHRAICLILTLIGARDKTLICTKGDIQKTMDTGYESREPSVNRLFSQGNENRRTLALFLSKSKAVSTLQLISTVFQLSSLSKRACHYQSYDSRPSNIFFSKTTVDPTKRSLAPITTYPLPLVSLNGWDPVLPSGM